MSQHPEIITSPLTVWIAPLGTAFPAMTEEPGAPWALLGTNGARSTAPSGVVLTHQQTWAASPPPAGQTISSAMSLEAEELRLRVELLDLSLEQYSLALGSNTVAVVEAAPGLHGTRTIGLSIGSRGGQELALLARGPSPYVGGMMAQYEVPCCKEAGSPQLVFTGRAPTGLLVEFRALPDAAATSEEFRFGRLIVQDQAPLPPLFTAAPAITGPARIGEALTLVDGAVTGGTIIARRLLGDGEAISFTGSTYVVVSGDLGSLLVFENTATGLGGDTVATSAAVGPVVAALPSFSVAPSITSDGSPAVGEVLTGNDGTIVGGTVSARAWLRDGTPISGATGGTYTPVFEDIDADLAFRVTATNAGGDTVATSATVGPITDALPIMTDNVTFGGNSLIANTTSTGVTAGNRASDVAQTYYDHAPGTATFNIAADGTCTDQVAATFLALASDRYNDPGVTNGHRNDLALQASSVVEITIDAAGSGGTDGFYPFTFSGGTAFTTSPRPASGGGVNVVGGQIVSVVPPTNPGGNYLTPPAVSVSVPGLTGATLTARINIAESIQLNYGRVMNVAGSKRVIMGDWTSRTDRASQWVASRKAIKAAIATWGARVLDALPYIMSLQTGGDAQALRGFIPSTMSNDGLHGNDNLMPWQGQKFGQLPLAVSGDGPAFVHDEVVGIIAGASVGTALATPRILGTADSLAIISQTVADVARIGGSAPFALTQGAGAVPAINEVTLRGVTTGKGSTNTARIVMLRQAPNTASNHVVNIKNNGQAILRTDRLTGAAATRKISFCALLRRTVTPAAQATFLEQTRSTGTRDAWLVNLTNGSFSFAPRTSAGTAIGSVNLPSSGIVPGDWNFFWAHLDVDAGIMRGGRNAVTPASTTPTAGLDASPELITSCLAGTIDNLAVVPFGGYDCQFVWFAQDYVDFTDSAVRDAFYNSGTMAGVVSGAGTVAGVTPLIFLRGQAGDYALGRNYGTGGDFEPVPFISSSLIGFENA